jgi:hypothetical protein
MHFFNDGILDEMEDDNGKLESIETECLLRERNIFMRHNDFSVHLKL